MPTRILRDGIITSEKVNSLSPEAELFYRRLMSVVDDFGRMELQIGVILARCYPLQLDRVTPSNVREWLSIVSEIELVTEYEVDSKKYLQINNFRQRERASKCPSPSNDRALPQNAARATPSPTTPHTPTTPRSTPTARADDRWKSDETYAQFISAYPGTTAIETDWANGHFKWRVLDWEQKAQAVREVARCDPAHVKLPQNYLADREWTRPPRPEPKSKLERMMDSL